ncbi:hypothetical protein RB195_017496 [Necator americanus]|uniref:Uncharacterized protein n=1 Tax=Necator americanus TaxID=51031 RepID=A0ABR1C8N5_NECAM
MGRRARYTDVPAESSVGYSSQTSSTSLTKLGNIFDDNSKGAKRVEEMQAIQGKQLADGLKKRVRLASLGCGENSVDIV